MPDGITPLGITKSIAATLTDHGITGVYGFSHIHRLDSDPGLMAAWETWVEAGHHLGNHTHLHAPLRWMSGDQYCEGASHWIPLHAPDRLNALLLDWLHQHRGNAHGRPIRTSTSPRPPNCTVPRYCTSTATTT
jgi:hypothetical protein